jgi:CheY-like chemotaxis protein/nitrogen-specific signal transduction histidine kinase
MLERLEDTYDDLKKSQLSLEESMESMRKAREEAEAANRAKTEFLANMSHELRTPLSAILGFGEIMYKRCHACSLHDDNLDIIIRNGRYLLSLIDDMLDMSRIEAGSILINREGFDLYQILHDIKVLIQQRADEKGLRFALEMDQDLPRYVKADPGKFRQVIFNLLLNAVKYTDQGGVTLRVRASSPVGAGFTFEGEVEDSGRGIAEKDQQRIFDKFVQIDPRGKTGSGTGLGLAITKKYIELMDGNIELHSVPGKGSVFRFSLPMEEVDEREVIVQREYRYVVGVKPGQQRYRMLIVEDDEENRLLLRKILAPLGFEVRDAVNGADGVKIASEWNPHLVWMDMRMPVMDGYEATRRIKAMDHGVDCKVIAVSASVFEDGQGRTEEAGCDGFLRKPYREGEVYGVIERQLGIEFIYEEAQSEPHGPEPATALNRDQLSQLPASWREQFCRATKEGRIHEMEQLVEVIVPGQKMVARQISELVRRFEFDRLLELLEEPPDNPQV